MTTAPARPAADPGSRAERPAAPPRRRIVVAVSIVAVAAVGLAVTGFALWRPITDTLEKQHRESFATYAEAEKGWTGVAIPEWIPHDSTDLHNLATTNEAVSVVRIHTRSPLPDTCVEAPRHGMIALTADWIPNPPPMSDSSWHCGSYEVAPVAGGWIGWFSAQRAGEKPVG